MMGLSVIRQLSREAAAKAQKAKKVPFLVEAEDIADWKLKYKQGGLRLPFPNIGDYRPEGYVLGEELFVDKTGWGQPGEPALTIEQLLNRLKAGMAYAIIEEGQFQLYIGEFSKVNSKPPKKQVRRGRKAA